MLILTLTPLPLRACAQPGGRRFDACNLCDTCSGGAAEVCLPQCPQYPVLILIPLIHLYVHAMQPAKRQVPGSRMHAIYAASYAPSAGNGTFPLAWNEQYKGVNAEDVTQFYLSAEVPAMRL